MNFPVRPPKASNWATEFELIFGALTFLTILFSIIVFAGVIFFAIKYREGSTADRSRPVYEDLRLELSWTIIPTLLGLGMFYFGAELFIKMRTMPADAQEIFIIGKQWMWHAQHSNGARENNTLHVPVGVPVKLTMISQDVIHALYIPAFRVQMHVVPGRYTHMWFTATKEGEYHLFCGMYCGTQHSEMGGKVVVLSQAEYAEWLKEGGDYGQNLTSVQRGQQIYNRLACNNCHVAESTVRGPSLLNLLGKTRRFTDGSTIVADESYIRESILRPYNRLTIGYGPTMPTYQGQISEMDVLDLISYMKTMGSGSEELRRQLTSGSIANRPINTDRSAQLQVGALDANEPRQDPTPTMRAGSPAVGALAVQEQMNQ